MTQIHEKAAKYCIFPHTLGKEGIANRLFL